jgi:DNA-binding NtrC family response regulator
LRTESTVVEESDHDSGTPGLRVLVMSLDSFGTYPLPERGELQIGRSGKCELQVEDKLASRTHAVLRVSAGQVTLEDLGSANGTKVRGEVIPAHVSCPIRPGDAIAVGSTVLVVQHTQSALGPRRLWSHSFFEGRVGLECGRSGEPPAPFAVVRLRLTDPAPWVRVLPVLAEQIRPPNIFAAYGPKDYEVLVLDVSADALNPLMEGVKAGLAPLGGPLQVGIARFPRDGRSVDALIAHANLALNPAAAQAAQLPAPLPTRSAALAAVYEMADRAAASNINALILGETGAGKEVMARYLHAQSPRSSKPFIAINCAGLPESLIEDELFGHEKGAFTGAVGPKPGLIEAAHEGTLFLDEVGEMPLPMQARLLRAIETREITRLGSVKPRKVDVRFLAATNRNLAVDSQAGRFRSDLYFRLNGMELLIPPLAERRDEIEGLATLFLDRAAEEAGRARPRISEAARKLLLGHRWPGNVRELKNVMERALLLCDGGEILPQHLPAEKMSTVVLMTRAAEGPATWSGPPLRSAAPMAQAGPTDEELASLKLRRGEPAAVEKDKIVKALELCVQHQGRAAKLLGISRRTLIYKMEKYGLPRPTKIADPSLPRPGGADDPTRDTTMDGGAEDPDDLEPSGGDEAPERDGPTQA